MQGGLLKIARAACASWCWVAANAHGAPMTDAERELLQSSVSVSQAISYGEQVDAAGLARIIKLEEPSLVQAFNNGMTSVGTSALPADIEALVIAQFDHPKVGEALRAFTPKYRTRKLFDLHYARIETGDVRSRVQIGNTDLAGIEEPLWQLLDKFESRPDARDWLALFLGSRKYPAAVPLLLESLRRSYLPTASRNPALLPAEMQVLLNYPSVEVWRQARAVLEDLHRTGVIPTATLEKDSAALDNRIRDPEKAQAGQRQQARVIEYMARARAIRPAAAQFERLRETDPSRFVGDYRAHLEKLEPLLAEYADAIDTYGVAVRYFELATYARFRANRATEAAQMYEESARHGHAFGEVAAGDTYQFDLRDKARAAKAYQRALDQARNPKISRVSSRYQPDPARVNGWLMEWLPNEIRYLRTGARYRRGVNAVAIEGFFDAAQTFGVPVRYVLAPQFPSFALGPALAGVRQPGFARPLLAARKPDIGELLARLDRASLGRQLDRLPASHLTLLATVEHVSYLMTDAAHVLRYLGKHDPSGYWSACLLGSVYAVDRKSAQGSDEARNALAQLLPGLLAPGASGPRPISAAAERLMKGRVSGAE